VEKLVMVENEVLVVEATAEAREVSTGHNVTVTVSVTGWQEEIVLR
jgi:uncharacterized Fe-S cluster-containing radical SAM superfamily protein